MISDGVLSFWVARIWWFTKLIDFKNFYLLVTVLTQKWERNGFSGGLKLA